jgi:predicted dehydrogenase
MNFAVIGSAHGHIYEFIEDMLKNDGKFIGVYEDHTNTAAKISQTFNVPIFTDLEKLLELDIDIAGTSAINNQKIDIIECCSEKSIHVMADKPLVVNKPDYNRLEKIVETSKIQIGLMLSMRFMPEVYTVKKIIEEGIIGDIINIEILTPHRLRTQSRPEWFFEKEKNGDLVVDLMIHSIDLFNWFSKGRVTDFKGTIHKKILKEKESFYDSATFLLQSSSGISGYLRTDWHITDTHWTWGDLRIFCVGTKGSIEARILGDPATRECSIVLFKEGQETKKVSIEQCAGSVTQDLLNRIQGREHFISHRDILEATRLSLDFDEDANIVSTI